ncbi:MAG: stage III sporulation protein AE, partial [Acutalibacteraceae bacterium]
SITLFAAQTLTWLTGRVVVPCLVISLAFGLTGAAAPDMRLPAVGGALSKGASWLMGVSATVFVGLLTLRGAVTSAADSLGGRAIRFSLASFVPVVGGAMGEAFNAIRGCLSALRATAGAVGVAATGLIVLPPLAECVGWALTLGICGTAAEMLALPSLSGLLKAAQGVIKALIAALLCCGLFLIVATTLVTLAKSGGG